MTLALRDFSETLEGDATASHLTVDGEWGDRS